jgi:pantothenate kinase
MEPIYQSLTTRCLDLKAALLDSSSSQTRILIALAGPPGSGKSTIAAQVVTRLNSTSPVPIAAIVPMDGFHLPRSTLDTLPNRAEAYARRGAAWTFDSAGILSLVHVLSTSRFTPPSSQDIILAPSFDHALKDPVSDGISIGPEIKIVVLEGNYLLLDEAPWREIKDLVDESWFVDVEAGLARERIAKRHLKSGIENSMELAYRRAEGNDLLNGVEIRAKLVEPKVLVNSVEE